MKEVPEGNALKKGIASQEIRKFAVHDINSRMPSFN
jgi:hypothetical protein